MVDYVLDRFSDDELDRFGSAREQVHKSVVAKVARSRMVAEFPNKSSSLHPVNTISLWLKHKVGKDTLLGLKRDYEEGKLEEKKVRAQPRRIKGRLTQDRAPVFRV